MAKLFIIGNGFDLAHGLPTSYSDFRQFLLSNSGYIRTKKPIVPALFTRGDACSDIDAMRMTLQLLTRAESSSNWMDIEHALGVLPYDMYMKINTTDDNMLSIYKAINVAFNQFFGLMIKWINSIDVTTVTAKSLFRDFIDRENDQFLTFNYTSTLEDIYSVTNICHIHGDAKSGIIFGHGMSNDLMIRRLYEQKHNGSGHYVFERSHGTKNASRRSTYKYFNLREINVYLDALSRVHSNDKKKALVKCLSSIRKKLTDEIETINQTVDEDSKNVCMDDCTIINDILKIVTEIDSKLRKDTCIAAIRLVSFISRIDLEQIDSINVIGLSFSDLDMKHIYVLAKLLGVEWIVDNYDRSRINKNYDKLRKCGISKIKFKKLI